MRLVALAVAGLVTIAAGPAFAQYQYAPRPVVPVGPMPPDGVFEMVRAMGLEPVGRPMRNGPFYVQRAADYYGKPLRVVVDASRGQVVSVEPVGGPPALYGGPYASTGGPYWRRPYPAYGAMPPDEQDIDYAPPGSIMAPPARTQPLDAAALPPLRDAQPRAQKHPATRSAAVTPGRLPQPRKRPAAAPQETAGSVDPLPVPQPAAPENAPAAAPKPADTTMPPVTPLD